MMKARPQDLLASAERSVSEGLRRIEAQRTLLAGLDPDSADALIARDTLHSHLATQIILQNHVRQLRRGLETELKASDESAVQIVSGHPGIKLA